jgi:type IV secretory pathway VirB10-like protein
MDKWKAAGHAGRNVEDALWQRFRAAQDVFFAARDAAQSEKDGEEKANLDRKIALVEEAEKLLPITDAAAAKKSLRAIGEKWESIGHVPRHERDRVEGRLRRVEEAIRKIEQDQWKRSNPESRARAEDTTAKFEEALQRAEKARDAARSRGDEKAALAAEATIEQMSGLLEAARNALEEFSR